MNLTKNSVFVSLLRWLSSTEMFARPAKQLPGEWQLFEFYTEPGGQLMNLKEDELKKRGFYWEITFQEEGSFHHRMNLPVGILNPEDHGSWHTSRNYLVVSPSENPDMTEEFQYALDNGNLKLLQKGPNGHIHFFGFFQRLDAAT